MDIKLLSEPVIHQRLTLKKYNKIFLNFSFFENTHQLSEWSSKNPQVKIASNEEAIKHGDIVIIAVKWTGLLPLVSGIGATPFKGKILIDAVNPIKEKANYIGELETMEEGAGQILQRLLPESHVVKAWNSVGSAFMIDPPFDHPTMPICGDDKGAKKVVGDLLSSVGWTPLDLGGINMSKPIEYLCPVWCQMGGKMNIHNNDILSTH